MNAFQYQKAKFNNAKTQLLLYQPNKINWWLGRNELQRLT